MPYKRAIFEFIIPKISILVGTDKGNDYEDIAIRFLEHLAEKYEIERFKIYSFDEFLNIIIEKHKCDELKRQNGFFTKLVNKVDFLSVLNKEEVILNIADILF